MLWSHCRWWTFGHYLRLLTFIDIHVVVNLQIFIDILFFVETNSYLLLVFIALRNNDVSLHTHINVVIIRVWRHHIWKYSLLSMAVFSFASFYCIHILSSNMIFEILLRYTRLIFLSLTFLCRIRIWFTRAIHILTLTNISLQYLFYRISWTICYLIELVYIKFSILLDFNQLGIHILEVWSFLRRFKG